MKKYFFSLSIIVIGIFIIPGFSHADGYLYYNASSSGSGTYTYGGGGANGCLAWTDPGLYFYASSSATQTGSQASNDCNTASAGSNATSAIFAYPTANHIAGYDAPNLFSISFDTYEGNSIYFSSSSNPVPPGPSPSLSLIGPKNGTTLQNFRNWLVKFNVATSTNMLYQIVLQYGTSTAYGYTDYFPLASQGTETTAGYLDIYDTITKGITLPDGTYHVDATLQMVPANVCPNWVPCEPIYVSTGDITFTISGSAPALTYSYFTTSTDPNEIQQASQYVVEMKNASNPQNFFGSTGITASSTATSTGETANCIPPQGLTDFGGGINWGLCEVAFTLFYPNNTSYANLQTAFQNFQETPPFAYIFIPLRAMQNAASNLASTTPQNLTFQLNDDAGAPGIIPANTITILSTDEFQNLTGSSTQGLLMQEELFHTEDYAMLILLIAFCVGIIIKYG